jgi:hypothetical protein
MTKVFWDIIDPERNYKFEDIYNLLDLKCKVNISIFLLSLKKIGVTLPKDILRLILIYTARKSCYTPKRWDESVMLWMNNFWMICPEQRKNNPLITHYFVKDNITKFMYLIKKEPSIAQVGEICKCLFKTTDTYNIRRWEIPMYGDYFLGLFLKDISAIEYIEVTIYDQFYKVNAKDLKDPIYFTAYTLTEKGCKKMMSRDTHVDYNDHTDVISDILPIYQLPPFLALPRYLFNIILVDIKLNNNAKDPNHIFNNIKCLWTFLTQPQSDIDKRTCFENQHRIQPMELKNNFSY